MGGKSRVSGDAVGNWCDDRAVGEAGLGTFGRSALFVIVTNARLC